MVLGVVMLILTSTSISTLNRVGIEELFTIFKEDFMENETYLRKDTQDYFINVKKEICCPCPFGNINKPERFWHMVTKETQNRRVRNNTSSDEKEKKRTYDSARAKRIHWVKILIDS